MNSETIKILLVEDNLGDADLLQEILEEATASEFEVTHTSYLRDAFDRLENQPFDAILLDLSLPDSQGLETLVKLQTERPDFPIVVITGLNDEQLAVNAVRQGAQDYLVKGQLNGPVLIRSLRYAIERKIAEIATRKSLERERELRELKSRFVSMVSHELRNPLTTIVAAAQLLEQRHCQLSEEKKEDMYRRIRKSAGRMNQLLDDILMIWKTEATEQRFITSRVNLTDFCQAAIEEFRRQLSDLKSVENSAEHQIVFNSDRHCLSFAEVDRTLLRQILTNLLSNAIKYSPAGGSIQFELACEEDRAVFEVKDCGIGIPEGDLEKLFTAFHRGSNTQGISGTGLGLAIVKKSVELHGGTIAVESQEGIGTRFTVVLPLKVERVQTQAIGIQENS
jgi:signal transduction histidine kinase